MDLLDKFWHEGGIAEDVYRELKFEESKLEGVNGEGSAGEFRPILVDWIVWSSKNMENVNRKSFSLNASTVHLAVRLMDLYLDRIHVPINEYFLTAATALILAAKFEEKETHIPKLSVVNWLLERIGVAAIDKGYFGFRERQMLNCIDWHLMIPTAPLFTPYFLSISDVEDRNQDWAGTTETEGDFGCFPLNTPLDAFSSDVTPRTPGWSLLGSRDEQKQFISEQVKKETESLLELTLKDGVFRNFRPSVVAAVCVAFARHRWKLSKWPPSLAVISTYSEDDIDNAYHELIRVFEDAQDYWPRPAALPVYSPAPVDFPLEQISPIRLEGPGTFGSLLFNSQLNHFPQETSGHVATESAQESVRRREGQIGWNSLLDADPTWNAASSDEEMSKICIALLEGEETGWDGLSAEESERIIRQLETVPDAESELPVLHAPFAEGEEEGSGWRVEEPEPEVQGLLSLPTPRGAVNSDGLTEQRSVSDFPVSLQPQLALGMPSWQMHHAESGQSVQAELRWSYVGERRVCSLLLPGDVSVRLSNQDDRAMENARKSITWAPNITAARKRRTKTHCEIEVAGKRTKKTRHREMFDLNL